MEKNSIILIIVGVLISFSGCLSRGSVYLKNSTSETLYFDNGCMGIKSPLLNRDSSEILESILSGKIIKHVECPKKKYGLKLALNSDTIHLSDVRYNAILDSLIIQCENSRNPCELIVTKSWFDQQKRSLNK